MSRKQPKSRPRRARGTGTIFFSESRGCWIGRRAVGRTAAGQVRYREVWGRTQGEVIRKLEQAGPPGPDCTIGEWAARWRETWSMRPGSKAGYARSLDKFIVPAIGHLKLATLTPSQVEAFGVRLTSAGGYALGANTALLVLAHLGIMLNAAVRDDLIPSNPAKLARKPKSRPPKIDPFTSAELATIIAEASLLDTTRPLAFAAGTGCRIGEALGLDIGDFARTPRGTTVAIARTFDYRYGLGPPKSERSERTIRLPSPLLSVVDAAKASRTKGPLFITSGDRRRGAIDVYPAWRAMMKRLGLRYRKIHELRHSVATNLISAGVPLGDVAAYLGDTVETVVKTYLHPAGTDPADTMERLLGGKQVGKSPKNAESPRIPRGKLRA